jgi:hypothetical protein
VNEQAVEELTTILHLTMARIIADRGKALPDGKPELLAALAKSASYLIGGDANAERLFRERVERELKAISA